MGKKKSRTSRASGGTRHQARANQQINQLHKKIKRWDRNQSDSTKVEAGKSRGGWDTSGMQKHLKILEKVKAKPALRP